MYYRGTKPKTERPKPKPRPLKREEIKMKIIKENRFCCSGYLGCVIGPWKVTRQRALKGFISKIKREIL